MNYNNLIKDIVKLVNNKFNLSYKEIHTKDYVILLLHEDDIILEMVTVLRHNHPIDDKLLEDASIFFLHNLLRRSIVKCRETSKQFPELYGKLSTLESKLEKENI